MVQQSPLKTAAQLPRRAATSSAVPRGLLSELRRLGVEPQVRASVCGYEAPYLGICLPVSQYMAGRDKLTQNLARIRALLLAGCAVTVSLVGAERSAPRDVEILLRHLQRAASAPCIDRRLLGIALPAQHLHLPAYLLMSRALLGNGPRYVILDETCAQRTGQLRGSSRANPFSTLYQHRTRQRAMSPVHSAGLRSRCALLPDERGPAVHPGLAMPVPADSAWLPLTVNVSRFCDHSGRLRETRFLAALREALQIADELFDQLFWLDARQRSDALRNRRIAILVQGIGDMLYLQQADPCSLDCLRLLDQLMAKIHDCLWSESQALAMRRGMLPALTARDPSRQISNDQAQSDWRDRWQAALSRAAVRHRNLLVMSPYALLPTGTAANLGFADLLPLLAYADALSFAGQPCFGDWRYAAYRAFHLRAMAVMQRRNAASFVAARV